MPKILPIQNNFSAGILSPRLHSRSDIEEYRAGVKDSVNFVPLRHGPIETRAGTRFLNTFEGTVGKLLSFQLTPDSNIGEGFPVIITDTQISLYGTNSATSGQDIIVNGSFSGGGANWEQVGPSAVVFDGEVATLEADLDEDTGVSQKLTVSESTGHLISFVSPSPSEDRSPLIHVSVGTTKGGTDILDKTRINPVGFNSGTNTEVWVTFWVLAGNYEDIVDTEPGNNFVITGTPFRDLDDAAVSAPSPQQSIVTFDHDWTPEMVPNLKGTMSPDGNVMYILSGDLVPYKLEYDVSISSWTFEALTFTDAPTDWVDGKWPTVATFFQGRSWWGGAAGKPNTLYASKTDEYTVFTLGENPNDALSLTLSRRGRIQWLEGARNLLIGTTNGEYIATSQGGVIAPNDAVLQQQSANGGAAVQSEAIGNLALYTSLDGRKLRSTSFDWDEQSWVSRDLTFVAEHLTDDARISEVSFAKDPESVLWITTAAGTLLGCTFEPYVGTAGWHRHVTNGLINSATVIETSAGSTFYLLVNRGDGLSLEVMDDESLTDSTGTQTDTFTDTFTFPHLANRTVAVTVDGDVHPNVILDTNGVGVLQWEGTEIRAGLPFTATLSTLPPDYGSMQGSAMTHSKRWSSITLRLYSSRSPTINGIAAPERSTETPMDNSEAYASYDLTVKNVGWGDGSIEVRQSLPVKTRISGLFGDLNQESL